MIPDAKLADLEAHWVPKILPFITQLFKEHPIPSHDHLHHLRTWQHAKKLLQAVSTQYNIPQVLPEQLILASLFHDTGLSQTVEENHGNKSAEICQHYFSKTPLPKSHFHEVLEAIKHHDDKEYKNKPQKPWHLYTLLTTADDLDAFGTLGVVRYIEIYSMRGIKHPELSNKAFYNLNQRFRHFGSQYKAFPHLYNYYEHKANYGLHLFKRITNTGDTEAQKLYNFILNEVLTDQQIIIPAPNNNHSQLIKEFVKQLQIDASSSRIK
jgi:HD superfamily phosphodiesterase